MEKYKSDARGKEMKTLKEYRKAKGYTQDEAAVKLGVTRQYVGALEKGERKPSLKLLKKIAEIYEVKIEKLIRLI